MLIQDKLDLIDHAFATYGLRSFAELGCAWGVDGGYGFYALERHPIDKAVQVDAVITDAMKARAPSHPQLTLLNRNFGDADVPGLIGDVDAVIFYDVLLHQVRPNWDEVLALYAPRTRAFVIYNQQWVRDADTVRLVELGKEEYFRSVPAGSEGFRSYINLFDNLDQLVPEVVPPRKRRDNLAIWQWGITDSDLVKAAERLGFRMQFFRNHGSAFGIPPFENHAFVFTRKG
jgi:hypothetical protein